MIKKWLQEIFSKKEPLTANDWRTDRSILQFLSSNMDDNGRLLPAANELPDEPGADGQVRFAPGLMDALFGASDPEDAQVRIAALSRHLKEVATKGDAASGQEFYRLITGNDGVIGIVDEFLQAIIDASLPIQPYLFNYAKDLATQTDNRNAVKFGIAILALCQEKSVLHDLKILGLHDEFTVFSTIAIMHLSDNVEQELWELAQKVDGWGKIQLVERLAKPELSGPVKDWLILDGFRNNIMNEYLALTCAIHGELHKKLEPGQVDRRLFSSAAGILDALVAENSPAGDITAYPYAAKVVQDFIRHAGKHAADVADLHSLYKIKDFLTALQIDVEQQKENGWDQDIISNCLIEIVAILNGRDWKTIAQEGLKSGDNVMYWHAKQVSEKLGIDVWEPVWARLRENPVDSGSWYDVVQHCKPGFSDEIIDFAVQRLPLEALSSGPKDANGFGEHYQKHASLEAATSFLAQYPGKGIPLILAALRSPVTRNRNAAIRVLGNWKQENWPPEIEKEIKQLRNIEPNEQTKESIEKLLKGEEVN